MIDDAVVEAAIRDVLKKRWLIGWWLRWRKLIKADLDKVSSLDLSQTQITDAGLKDVAKLQKPEYLYLPTRITDLGLKEVAKLSMLWLTNTRITDAGLKEVAKMKQLKGLGLGGCKQITAENVAELKKALPKCDIDF